MSVVGKEEASPAIISEKKIPIDSAMPALKNVPRIPEADPRCLAGTLFMIMATFGAENSPEPTPFKAIRVANSGYGKSTGSASSAMNDAATSDRPPTANHLVPNRSERCPDTGPETKNPTVNGSR